MEGGENRTKTNCRFDQQSFETRLKRTAKGGLALFSIFIQASNRIQFYGFMTSKASIFILI